MNKKIRIICIALSLLFTVLFFSSCDGGTADAQKAFEEIMEAFKSGDDKTIDEIYGFTEIASFVDKTSGENLREAVISTLSEMDYQVNSAERISSTAVRLNVDIETVNFSEIVNSYIDKITELTGSREYQSRVSSMSDEEYEALMTGKMIEAITEADGEKITKTLEVIMTKSGSVWKLGGNSEEFLEALFAGLGTAVESLM